VTTIGGALADSHGVRSMGERCVVTSPPVDFTRFKPDPAVRAAARAELGIPDAAIAIGTVGNRNPTKGHLYLVEAAERLPGAHVRIMGARSPVHAEYEQSIHDAIAARGLGDRVKLVEPGARVAELMPAFDVYTMTSVPRSEGMPTAIIEAMGCGLPVVATDVGAVSEEVEEGVTGYVVPPLDVAAIGSALARLVDDAALRERLGAAGRERALRLFAPERVVANRLRAYDLALAHRRARS
jgi:glycosyltransferase involved in cell wall biosynthesis